VVPLDAFHAQAVGALLARSGTHVVICVQASDLAIITSDPLDLTRLDPDLPLIRV
jgi:hypothetical protein